WPSGEKARPPTDSENVCSGFPVVASHRIKVIRESQPPLARVLPSGEKATHQGPFGCPRSTMRSLPVAGSHKRTVPSQLADANVEPSGENATERIACPTVCPRSETRRPLLHSPQR